MRELVWEWLLADGSTVRATLDRKRNEESVWVGKRLVSRAAIGTKPDGHRIAGSPYRDVDARVIFDGDAELADLRRGDDVVAPHTWPGQSRERLRRAALTALPMALCSFVVVSGAMFASFAVGSRLATNHVDRLAGPVSESPAAGTAASSPPQVVPATTVARHRRLPSVISSALRVPPAPPPRRTTLVAAPRTAPAHVTVNVVCDEQGACQGVKPVRLALTR